MKNQLKVEMFLLGFSKDWCQASHHSTFHQGYTDTNDKISRQKYDWQRVIKMKKAGLAKYA